MMRNLFRSVSRMHNRLTPQEFWSGIEADLKASSQMNPLETEIKLRNALENIKLVSASYGTKAPLIAEVDRPHYTTAALDTINEMASTALRGL